METWLKIAEWLKANPWLTLLGFLLTAFSIILAIIFFIKSRRIKDPQYAIRNTNLIRDFTSRLEALEMTYAGERISNLTVTKLAFWNNGKDTINMSDIASADPLRVRAKSGFKILDSSLLYAKNDANQFSIRRSEDGSCVLIQFDYLDQGEGGIIQFLHTGRSSGDIEVHGTIKGAGKLNRCFVPIFPILRILSILLLSSPKTKRWTFARFLFIVPVVATVVIFLTPVFEDLMLVKGIFVGALFFTYWGTGFYMLKRRIPKGFEIFEEDFEGMIPG